MTEAKSLLEQLCLIGAGRPFYGAALRCMQGYVKDDLRRLDIPPAELQPTLSKARASGGGGFGWAAWATLYCGGTPVRPPGCPRGTWRALRTPGGGNPIHSPLVAFRPGPWWAGRSVQPQGLGVCSRLAALPAITLRQSSKPMNDPLEQVGVYYGVRGRAKVRARVGGG